MRACRPICVTSRTPSWATPPISTLRDLLDPRWTHHVPRLMLLGNYALLAGVDPQALTEWFHTMYVDAYDWVMVSNVIGMSQWADGGVMATKPYVASANDINRMTTYCGQCPYDQGARIGDDACPFNALYWDFMGRHRARLSGNRRLRPLLSTLDRFEATSGGRPPNGPDGSAPMCTRIGDSTEDYRLSWDTVERRSM